MEGMTWSRWPFSRTSLPVRSGAPYRGNRLLRFEPNTH
jgi:hypothetical protein